MSRDKPKRKIKPRSIAKPKDHNRVLSLKGFVPEKQAWHTEANPFMKNKG